MRNTVDALYGFFSSFGIPAYLENAIPDNVQMPYITYELGEPEPLATALFHASVWYRDTRLNDIIMKVDEIEAALYSGVNIQTDTGSINLFLPSGGTKFAQIMSDPNPETKRAYLTLVMMRNTY